MPKPPKTTVISKQEIGARLRALRAERGISQVELATMLGTFQTTISAIERGARGLTLQHAAKLAQALDAVPGDLLGPSRPRPTIKDRRFVRRLEKIDQLPKRDQQALLRTIDAFLGKVS